MGNDGVDQLSEFNKALVDHTPRDIAPRSIDGIILTKFDTIDDKVTNGRCRVGRTGACAR